MHASYKIYTYKVSQPTSSSNLRKHLSIFLTKEKTNCITTELDLLKHVFKHFSEWSLLAYGAD